MAERKVIGNYEIIERVGSGSMGAVFKARQISMDRVVALKILPPKLAANEAFVQRFLREAQSAGKLSHANLIQVIEVGRAGQYYFYSMEFVGGATLKQVLGAKGPLPEATAVDYMTKIAGALAEAHRQGIVHRDVKPDNIILTDQGEPKLADLGLAKPMSGAADVTMGGAAIGTPHYMAPEQGRGEEVDGRADLYALGATFFRLLTGVTLFEGPTAAAVMVKHSTEPPRKLRELRADASAGLEAVLAKLLAKKPEDRYRDAEALADDLRAVRAGNMPRHARIAIDSARLKRARRRRREGEAARQGVPDAGAVPAKAGSRAIPIVAAGGAFLAVIVGGVLMFRPSGDEPERPAGAPARPPVPVPASPRVPRPVGRDVAPSDEDAAAMYAAAEAFARENPDEFERAIGFFEKAGLAGKGTAYEIKAESKAFDLRSAWKKKAGDALDEAMREAKALVGKGDYDAAIASLQGVPASLASQVADELKAELDAVRAGAAGRIDAAIAGATGLLEQNDLDGARKALASVERIRYAQGRAATQGRIEALEARIKQAEAAKLSAAEREAGARLDAALAGFESHVLAGEYAEGRKLAQVAAAKEKLAPAAQALKAAARVATVLAGREKAIRRAVEARVGEEVTLSTKAGPRKGEVASTSDAGVVIVTKMYVNRQVVGQSRSTVPWKNLTEEQRDELASGWKPPPPDGAIALAFVAINKKDADAVAAALAKAPGHPLADRLRKRAAVLRVGEAEVAAAEAWTALKKRVPTKKLSPARADELLKGLAAFGKAHGRTEFAASKADEIAALRGRIETVSLVAHLVGHWTFDEGGGKKVRDVSGRGNHGTMKTLRWTTGRFGGALEFDGTDEVKVPYSEAIVPGTSDFSACLWMRSDSGEARGVLSLHPGGYHGGKNCWTMGVRGERGTLSAGVNDMVNGCRADGKTAALDGEWHHVALVRTGGEVLLYVDGDLDGSGRAAGPADIKNENPLRIGNKPHVRDSFFVGTIDDVRLYSCALSPTQVRSLASPEGAAPPPVAAGAGRGLIGHWKLDETGGAVARDSSGRGNHGEVKGGARWTKGRLGGALAFDGTDDVVLIPNESDFDITGNITVAAWIKVAAFTKSWQSIVTKGDRAWRLHRVNDMSSLGWACSDLSRGEVGDLYGKVAVDDGRWHHVAGVHDGTKTYLFVDGKVDASARTSPTISVNDYSVLIGENAEQTGRHFQGLIDDVRVYDRALAVHEIRALAGAAPASAAGARGGLVGHWKFDERTGAAARDSSGNGNHGAIRGTRRTKGKAGGALWFDGKDDHVLVPDSDSLDVTGELTIAAWLWLATLDTASGRQTIVAKYEVTGGKRAYDFGFGDPQWAPHKLYFTVSSTGAPFTGGVYACTSGLDIRTWYHVAVVFAPDSVTKIYVNGVESAGRFAHGRQASGINTNDLALQIGGKHDKTGGVAGILDDVRIYDRALAADEIRALWGRTTGAKGAADSRPPLTIKLSEDVTMELVYVPPGRFMMGSSAGQPDERPVREVEITRGFYVGKHEVTEAQYQRVMRAAPAEAKGPEYPVAQVSWDEAALFCRRLSTLARKPFRLPTEAEWEYACRAGSKARYCFGGNAGRLGEHAWFKYNSGGETHPVGRKKPNAWGLYDMHGNVWEWCLDWYAPKYVVTGDVTKDPAGPARGSYRVHRGGSWANADHYCRSARRPRDRVTDRSPEVGFRIVTSAGAR